jgi:hypothetical protein
MSSALPLEHTSVFAQVTFQISELHRAAVSRGSRRDRGELSCRAPVKKGFIHSPRRPTDMPSMMDVAPFPMPPRWGLRGLRRASYR